MSSLTRMNGTLGVYISPMNRDYAMLFMRQPDKYTIVERPQIADIIVFTGGADVNPQLYGQAVIPGSGTSWSPHREEHDALLFDQCENKLVIGICRGAQYLNVRMGGSMWQDVSGHATTYGHKVKCSVTEKEWSVTSTHHQAMIPNFNRKDMMVIATAQHSGTRIMPDGGRMFRHAKDTYKATQTEKYGDFDPDDYEVLWYENDEVLCFQPHPEFGHDRDLHKETYTYFHTILDTILKQPTVVEA